MSRSPASPALLLRSASAAADGSRPGSSPGSNRSRWRPGHEASTRGRECAGPSPVDRRKLGMRRYLLVKGYGIPLDKVLAPANRHDSPLLDRFRTAAPCRADERLGITHSIACSAATNATR